MHCPPGKHLAKSQVKTGGKAKKSKEFVTNRALHACGEGKQSDKEHPWVRSARPRCGSGMGGKGRRLGHCLHLGLGWGWTPCPLLVERGAHFLWTPSHICMYGAPAVCQNPHLTCVVPHHPGLSFPHDATTPPARDAHTVPALSLPLNTCSAPSLSL